jgi:hypothetical protein
VAVLGIAVALGYFVRIAVTVLLIAAAPLALACHAFPPIDAVARLWWRALGAVLAIQVGQGLVFAAAVRVFLSGDGPDVFGLAGASGLVNLLVCAALLYILVRIPVWALRAVFTGHSRSRTVGMLKTLLIAKTLGAAGLLGTGGRTGHASAARRGTRTTGGAGTASGAAGVGGAGGATAARRPAASTRRARAGWPSAGTAGGSSPASSNTAPMAGAPGGRPAAGTGPARPASAAGTPRQTRSGHGPAAAAPPRRLRGRQLALPLGLPTRPTGAAGRPAQLRLPIQTPPVPRTAGPAVGSASGPLPPAPPAARPAPPRVRQLRLPIEVARPPRPARPGPARPAARPGAGQGAAPAPHPAFDPHEEVHAMSSRSFDDTGLVPARVPADIDRPDRLVADLTARQVAILAAAGVVLWLGYTATAHRIPLGVFALAATPVLAGAIVLALGSRDGLSLDRLALAALRQARAPRRLVHAPDGVPAVPGFVQASSRADPGGAGNGRLPAPLRLPAQAISPEGVIDLGPDGAAVIAAASTVNFGLRTAGEQAGLIAAYARWLNSLTGPVQLLIRAYRLDVAPAIAALTEAAPHLPHPALERAALEHAAFLAELAATRDLLGRQVLVVVREPAGPALTSMRAGRKPRQGGSPAASRAAVQARRRAAEAAHALVAAEIAVTVLAGAAAGAVLAAACAPGELPPPDGLAAADQPVTGPAWAEDVSWPADGGSVSTADDGDGFGGLPWTA